MTKLFLAAFVVLCSYKASFALGGDVPTCRGQVKLEPFGVNAQVTLPLPNLVEGGHMDLWHPITEDTENAIDLRILKLVKTPSGTRVFAAYDYDLGINGFLTFEVRQMQDGVTQLVDFKGFEGPQAFGPTEIICRLE